MAPSGILCESSAACLSSENGDSHADLPIPTPLAERLGGPAHRQPSRLRRRRHTHAEPYGHTHADPYAHTHADPYAHTHADPYAHTHADPYAHTHTDPYAHTHADPYAHTPAEPHGHTPAGPYGHTPAGPPHGHTPAGPHGHTQAEPYGHTTHVHRFLRLRQRRVGPHLRGEDRRLRALLGQCRIRSIHTSIREVRLG